jgi:hypothetical protein
MLIVNVIIIVKAFDNSQWLLDWFMTHADTIEFKQDVIAFTIAHT